MQRAPDGKFEKTDNTKAVEQLALGMNEQGDAIMALHKRISVLEAVVKVLTKGKTK